MMNLNALKIDPEFQGKIPPLNFEEEQQLEQNILHEGRLLNPIIIWNGFILDGHTRYRILRKHPFIVYQIQEIELANRYAALSWICQNQLGRRNLDPERKKFLMGKLYESEKLARGGSKERAHDENGRFTSMVQNDPLRAKQLSTCERIAAQNGVGAATVKRAEKYAKGVDAAEDAVPGAREEILTGRIKATDAEITALAKTPKAEIPAALAELRKPKQERQPRKAETSSSKQTLSEISKSIQGHQRQLTAEERTFLKASIDNRYQERAVANGSLMMCEVQGAKEDFIRRWNTIFKEYPDVFEDSDCRKPAATLQKVRAGKSSRNFPKKAFPASKNLPKNVMNSRKFNRLRWKASLTSCGCSCLTVSVAVMMKRPLSWNGSRSRASRSGA